MVLPGCDGTPPTSPHNEPDGTIILVVVDSSGNIWIEVRRATWMHGDTVRKVQFPRLQLRCTEIQFRQVPLLDSLFSTRKYPVVCVSMFTTWSFLRFELVYMYRLHDRLVGWHWPVAPTVPCLCLPYIVYIYGETRNLSIWWNVPIK